MIVCICKGITENTIKEMLEYSDIETIKEITGASTQCTKCAKIIEEIAESTINNVMR